MNFYTETQMKGECIILLYQGNNLASVSEVTTALFKLKAKTDNHLIIKLGHWDGGGVGVEKPC